MIDVETIKGEIAKDYRGQIRFVNDFDMTSIKRFYIIKNADTDLVRGWRAHRIEQRWFYVISGSFSMNLIKIDNWESPDPDLDVEQQVLRMEDMNLVHVPAGYGTAFKAMEPNSELLVYANYPLSHAPLDNYTWPLDYFINLG